MRLSVKKFFIAALLPCFLISGCAANSPKQVIPDPAPAKTEIWPTQDVDVSRISHTKKLVALTFDDAPTDKLDALLSVFIEYNKSFPNCPASATIFCNGNRLSARAKESLATAFALGIELGNHTFSHLDLTTLSPSEIEEEIGSMDKILQEIDGKPLHLFRAPYGRTDERLSSLVKTPIIDWFIDTEDWSSRSPAALLEAVFARIEDGAIILMHDGYESTVEGVKMLLPALTEAGYQAVSVSQLAKAHGCHLKTGKVYTRARKQKA